MAEDETRNDAVEAQVEDNEADVPADDDLMTIDFLRANGSCLASVHMAYGEYGSEPVLRILSDVIANDDGAVQLMNMMGISYKDVDAAASTMTIKGLNNAGEAIFIKAQDVDRIEASLEDY